jgi:hypothetical protein
MVVQLSFTQSVIKTLLGKAGGGFASQVESTPVAPASNFYLSDLNGDGHPDLISISYGSTSVLLGKGNGEFQPAHAIFSQTIPSDTLAVGDLNGDGYPDIAIPVANGIFILFGDGTAGFPSGTTFTTTEQLTALAIADMNGDGRQDLVAESSPAGIVEILLGNGRGKFGAPNIYFTGGQGEPPLGLAIGDVNGDGIPDIVTPDPVVLIGKGDGTFADPVPYPTTNFLQSVQLADLRGDGLLDLVGSVFLEGVPPVVETLVLLNAGHGRFMEGVTIPIPSPSLAFAVADFNQDGLDDVAVSTEEGILTYLGTGKATTPLRLSASLALPLGVYEPSVGDFNNDGILDLLGISNETLSFFAGHGDGTFASPVTVITPLLEQLAIGDFDGDGNLDFAGAEQNGPTQIYRGDGAGGFQLWTTIPTLYATDALTAVDLNHDGKLDLLRVPQSPSNQVVALLNQGNGSFISVVTMMPPLQQAGYLVQLIPGDINQDGIPDIFVPGGSHSYVLLGNGDGTFALQAQTFPGADSGLLTDLNGDGFPDLLFVNGADAQVFLGDGQGSFSYPGHPDGLWLAPPGASMAAPFNLHAPTKTASGFANVLTLGSSSFGSFMGLLLNEGR